MSVDQTSASSSTHVTIRWEQVCYAVNNKAP